jgi:hypothetical protein
MKEDLIHTYFARERLSRPERVVCRPPCTIESDDAPALYGAEGGDVIHKRSKGLKGHVRCLRCGIAARVAISCNLKPQTQEDEDS